MFLRTASAVLVSSLLAAPASALIIDGIEFPDGAASFADAVVDSLLGDGVADTYDDPLDVLGVPDWDASAETGSFSLGLPGATPDALPDDQFGFVTVQFTDNSLTTSGNADPDLFVFEIGNAVERFTVEISQNNVDWILIGEVSGQPTQLDIDGVSGVTQGTQYSFVRVTDAPDGPSSGDPFGGPDIDAIGAISSAPPVIPLPAAGWALLAGLGALAAAGRRRTG